MFHVKQAKNVQNKLKKQLKIKKFYETNNNLFKSCDYLLLTKKDKKSIIT